MSYTPVWDKDAFMMSIIHSSGHEDPANYHEQLQEECERIAAKELSGYVTLEYVAKAHLELKKMNP